MQVKVLQPASPTWNAEIDRIGALIGAQNNPDVLPYHFLQVVLPGLGGYMVEVVDDGHYLLVGFLFPRGLSPANDATNSIRVDVRREYTFRYHALAERANSASFIETVTEEVRAQVQAAAIVPYSPRDFHTFTSTNVDTGSALIGRPTAIEAEQIRELHHEIWNSPREYIYPTDIHCDEFQLGTTLVARVDDTVAGFLFGFYRFGGPVLPADWSERFGGALRIESQVMGVSPRFRGMRLGNLLKRVQANEARANGISLIHWTADPLQYPNAALNFGLLRAIAVSFRENYYPFRNDLNRVPASRFALTWLIGTRRVLDVPITGSPSLILDLEHQPEIVIVNDGYVEMRLDAESSHIAIEIPADWVGMQRDDLPAAQRWRDATDRLFGHYVGIEDGQYAITGAAVYGDKRYLVGQRADNALWDRLAL